MASELTRFEVHNGLSQEVVYLPNGDSLALVGDVWYHATSERETWKALAGVEEQLAKAYVHQQGHLVKALAERMKQERTNGL